MNFYNQYLSLIESCIGHKGPTFTSELDSVGRTLFPKKFKGVFARDSLPHPVTSGYYIVNLDRHDEPGSHWVAICDEIFYDSFGRHSKNELGFLQKWQNTEDDSEQVITEEDCGLRCLAWMCVYHVCGLQIALTI